MNDYGDFSNSKGALNKNAQKKSPNAPDYTGNMVLDEEAIRYLVAQIKSGVELPKIRISGWLKDGQFGKFISLKASKAADPSSRPGGFQKAPPPPPKPAFEDDSSPF